MADNGNLSDTAKNAQEAAAAATAAALGRKIAEVLGPARVPQLAGGQRQDSKSFAILQASADRIESCNQREFDDRPAEFSSASSADEPAVTRKMEGRGVLGTYGQGISSKRQRTDRRKPTETYLCRPLGITSEELRQ